MAILSLRPDLSRRYPDCIFSARPLPGASARSCASSRGLGTLQPPLLAPSLVRPRSCAERGTFVADDTSIALDQLRGRAQRLAERAGAVVIGGDYRGLGIVRSLGRHGIPVWVLTD